MTHRTASFPSGRAKVGASDIRIRKNGSTPVLKDFM
jgi:hypothetical protein